MGSDSENLQWRKSPVDRKNRLWQISLFPKNLPVLATTATATKRVENEKFDMIVYIPPTKSGTLVRNFAEKISRTLKIPISHNLIKNRETSEQKVFENSCLKNDNVRDAFSFRMPEEVAGKTILVIDDIFDSGATMKEIGIFFTKLGAEKIAPLVIAKTVGGDLA